MKWDNNASYVETWGIKNYSRAIVQMLDLNEKVISVTVRVTSETIL